MEALKGLAELPRLGLGAEALEGLLGGLAGLARRLGGAGLFGVGVRREADEVGAVVLGDAGLGLGRLGLGLRLAGRLRAAGVGFGLGCPWLLGTLGRLGLGLGLVGRLRAAGVSGPYGLGFGLGCPWLLGTLGRLGLGLWLAGRLRAAGVSGPYGLAFGLGCPWLFGSLGRLGLPRRGLVGRERLRGGGRLAGGTFRLGLLTGRLRAAGVSGPYGRPFGLGLLDRGRLLLLGRCLF